MSLHRRRSALTVMALGLLAAPAWAGAYEDFFVAILRDDGTAITALSDALSTICYIGDDHGDLAAFDALDAMDEAGHAGVRVAVRSDEADAELLRRADIVVDGPEGALALLSEILRRVT